MRIENETKFTEFNGFDKKPLSRYVCNIQVAPDMELAGIMEIHRDRFPGEVCIAIPLTTDPDNKSKLNLKPGESYLSIMPSLTEARRRHFTNINCILRSSPSNFSNVSLLINLNDIDGFNPGDEHKYTNQAKAIINQAFLEQNGIRISDLKPLMP